MNAPTLAVKALADVILRAQENGRRTPMGIAFAIDAARMVMSPETAAELDRLRTRVTELEQLLAESRPADEDPIAYELTAEAGKVTRGAGGITQADAEPTVEVFRAEYEHEITPIESYTTRAVAREHCETEAREGESRERDVFELEWRTDPDDERVEELWVVGTGPGDEERTGYSVTAVAIATDYDREADR